MAKPTLYIQATDPEQLTAAKQLIQDLEAELFTGDHLDTGLLLEIANAGISLKDLSKPQQKPWSLRFESGKSDYRRRQQGPEKLLQALRPSPALTIIDATAGLGRDAFVLASAGHRLILLEREPVLCLLLKDALQRAANNPISATICQRMQLIETDALDYLQQPNPNLNIDAIYLDPMFPERSKSAAVKKETQLLHALVSQQSNNETLFESALINAKKRVVVKRPKVAPYLAELTPDHQVIGSGIRYDIYYTSKRHNST